MPLIAPSLFTRFENIPKSIAGKNEDAASPKASATVAATKPGGLIPKYPAKQTAAVAAIRAAMSSPLSEILGIIIFLSRSCDTADEITNSSPAAVESAAAKAPAANKAITQLGRLAISGFAKTIISTSTSNSFVAASAVY
ncbi:MAG: Uncharacterised protein [Bacteroidota bacterium]|nr:MAG: Uncharacterised protein [Bacteroidota bacterium]